MALEDEANSLVSKGAECVAPGEDGEGEREVNRETQTMAMNVAYRGDAFCGFARQPGLLTVQGELEQALEMLFRRPVTTVCAGRTDTGVHACGQVVSFDLSSNEWFDLPCFGYAETMSKSCPNGCVNFKKFERSMNALTHDDIVVSKSHQAPNGFSARFDAKAREYRYFMAVDDVPPVFSADFAWWTGPLDAAAMKAATDCLVGEHDFKSFCRAVSAVDKPTVREMLEFDFWTEEHAGENLLVFKVVGSSFLHSMVRTLVGSLVAIGQGKRSPEWMAEVLAARDRTAAGECAPAHGLVLWGVKY